MLLVKSDRLEIMYGDNSSDDFTMRLSLSRRYRFAAIMFIYRLATYLLQTLPLVAVIRKRPRARARVKKCQNEVDSGWRRWKGRGGGIGGLRMASLWYRIMTSVMRDAIIAGKRRPGHRQKYYLWFRGDERKSWYLR